MAGAGGVGGSSGGGNAGGAGSSQSDKGSSSSGKSDHGGGSDRSSSKSDKGKSSSRSDKDTFGSALSDASKNSGKKDSKPSSTSAPSNQSGVTSPTDDPSNKPNADRDAKQAARNNTTHANEFSGLDPSANASRNSHRGYGPDTSVAGSEENPDPSLDGTRAAITGGVVGLGVVAQQKHLNAVNSVADRLGKPPTSNLPAHPDFKGSNKAYAAELRNQKTATAALKNLPQYKGGVVRETLEEGARVAKALGRAATGAAVVADPAITAIVSGVQKEGTLAEKVTEAIVEGSKRADNAVVSAGAGGAAAIVTIAGTKGAGTLAAPVVAGYVGIKADQAYKAIGGDAWFDSKVEAARPRVQQSVENVLEAAANPGQAALDIATAPGRFVADIASDAISYVADNIDSWEEGKTNEALSHAKQR